MFPIQVSFKEIKFFVLQTQNFQSYLYDKFCHEKAFSLFATVLIEKQICFFVLKNTIK